MITLFNDPIDLTELLAAARETADAYEEGKPSYDGPARMAGMALELARIHDLVLDALEPLKESLRDVAAKTLGDTDDTAWTLDGVSEYGDNIGHVTVTFPAKGVKLSKDANIDRLKRTLGPRFHDYFEERVSYKPVKDFQARTLAALRTASSHPEGGAEARVVMAEVEVVEPTPRVGFKPKH